MEGVTTLFVYDQEGRLILETEAGAEVAGREYLHRGDNRLAMYDMAGDAWYFFQNDPIGTPVAVTDEDNRIVWEAVYLPCGEAAVNPASLIEFNLRFAGQYYDAETGLHYNYHRYYDPRTGRYLTPDPIGLDGGINPFAYIANNPINLIDPYGLDAGIISGPAAVYGAAAAGTAATIWWYNHKDQMAEDLGRFWNWLWNESENGNPCEAPNNNPYDGPVEDPVIVVDPQGNAIPVDRGEQIQTSRDGQWVDVKDSDGRSTGPQIHGPHKPTTHGNQPDALKPHAHRPGNPGGNHWLPVH